MEYPEWICHKCGVKHGGWYENGFYKGPETHCATYHVGNCDICNAKEVSVTEPRDYGYLLNWGAKDVNKLDETYSRQKLRTPRKKGAA
jgi:hypothetical protein